MVVICLKNRTFAVSQTSLSFLDLLRLSLWFAWKIVLLQYHKHLSILGKKSSSCCDLLEKSYFCSITNILLVTLQRARAVVICLKNRTFAVSQTSEEQMHRIGRELWFAWKIVLLQYHKHPEVIANSLELVVICLKNRTFAVSQTSSKL